MKRVFSCIGLSIFTFLMALLALSARWALSTWANLSAVEVIYHLTSPLEGTGGGMVDKFLLQCVLPAGVITLVVLVVYLLLVWKKGDGHGWIRIVAVAAFLFVVTSAYRFWNELEIGAYLGYQDQEAVFIDSHYVDPSKVELKFPEEKRNLIMIFLESMETTFVDVENGGAFQDNIIPELTYLAQKHEDFSGKDDSVNGGYVMPGASWTIAAMFAHTSGVPLQISIGENSMDTQEHFFKGLTALGDILEQEEYQQVLVLGSDAEFGGRLGYYLDHGDFEIEDYMYAQNTGMIEPGYYVNWGYEDKKLFAHAKERLTELAAEEEPFHMTLLTVDTHFEDGYICEDCENHFGDQYSDVYACSSRRVAEFVSWVQEQDFYKNTTIVIVGDHLTMDKDFCNNVTGEYDRKVYTSFINSACEPENASAARTYTTFDTFPTVLAALGVEIEGERLGLGTNLFSDTPTLAEDYGIGYLREEVQKKSALLEELSDIQVAGEGITIEDADNAFSGTTDLTVYLQLIKEHPEYTVIMAVQDEGTNALTDADRQKLAELGIQTELKSSTHFRSGFYAILSEGVVDEKAGYERLLGTMTLADGRNCEVVSAGFDQGATASVRIDKREFAIGKRGLNIVVYDPAESRVIDSVCFDTYLDRSASREK